MSTHSQDKDPNITLFGTTTRIKKRVNAQYLLSKILEKLTAIHVKKKGGVHS